ncbi:hypothetical protein CCHOA_05090 [Corynebacterium choanae]|uniref:Uncharacterized protein n=1 Tax=Corynebacterium choanae TaxID=1862358 RepID=A0A3G6J6N8_9CORY|nr:hypothetical protein CCHOA_05090 [Corynebacterium choanae]
MIQLRGHYMHAAVPGSSRKLPSMTNTGSIAVRKASANAQLWVPSRKPSQQ